MSLSPPPPSTIEGSAPSASLESTRRARLLRLLFDAAGWVVWLAALRALWRKMDLPVGFYDEGILLTDAQLLLAGKLPYRDFYSNYPPGVFLLLAGMFKLFGSSVLVERWVGVVARAAAGLWAGRFGGQVVGKPFSSLTAGLVTLWLAAYRDDAYAYILAVQGVFLALVLIMRAQEQGGRSAYVLAGVVLGAVSWMRHDLFGMLVMALAAGALLVALKQRAWRPEVRSAWAWLPWLAAGVALTVIPFWGTLFALVDPRLVLEDLVFDQARYVLPARDLPMPPLLPLAEGRGMPFPLPLVLHLPFESAVGSIAIAPLLVALAVWRPGRTGARGRFGSALLLAFSLAVMPQMLGRTDLFHAICTIAPAMAVFGLWVERLSDTTVWRWPLALCLFGALLFPVRGLLLAPAYPLPPALPGFERANGREISAASSRQAVLEFIQKHTHSPKDPIYIGLQDHSYVLVNEVDLYFFADRVGATRYMQFDPNIVNRLDVQQRMAEEIEASGTRVAILSALTKRSVEPNDSAKQGSHYLDQYLREHFQAVQEAPPYVMMLRRD
ncbi:hypothetical protein [Hyalangium versicolor]|uniref:hypothetical protein n=1 Tax=Hyalangium versicolor TaxID=2861190 RepID=UPI001CCCEE95|nr:hypothetical protein [Hyalangium versicolor]